MFELASRLGLLESGFYLDVGANLPTKRSNTFRLYLGGMRGICLEPNLELACLYERARPFDHVICAAVGLGSSIKKLSRFNFHVFSTCSSDDANEREIKSSAIGARVLKTSFVSSVSVENILRGVEMKERPELFLIKTDTEGFDLQVLESNCWISFRPIVVLSESTGEEKKVRTLMEEAGYRLAKSFPSNQLFLRNDIDEVLVSSIVNANG